MINDGDSNDTKNTTTDNNNSNNKNEILDSIVTAGDIASHPQ